MPKVHEYRDGKGLYIKASHQGRITTYQVTPEGVTLLHDRGHTEGTTLSPRELQFLLRNDYIYTGQSGAGYIDAVPSPTLPSRVPSPPWVRRKHSATPIYWPIVVFIFVIILILTAILK